MTWMGDSVPLQAALDRALAYVHTHPPQAWHVDVVPLLAFLERRYGLAAGVPYAYYYEQAGDYRPFLAFTAHAGWDTSGLGRLDALSQAYARLFLCKFGTEGKSDMWLVREWWAEKRGYGITHAYLLAWMAQRCGCNVRTPLWKEILDQAPEYFREILSYHPACEDLTIETLVFWAISGKNRAELYKALVEMVSHQLPDGGWAWSCGDVESNQHATLLAIWALYAYLQPDKNSVCFWD
ncbi:MAG: hypothetical protein ACUVRD_01240 [Bacteroidia bacterium]